MQTKAKPKIEQTADGLLVVRLYQVPVNYDRTWEEAVRAGCPDTPANYPIWQVGDQYPKPDGKSGVELTDISLFGYGRSWGSQKAVDRIAAKKLPAAEPRHIFAIGEAYPRLHTDIGRDFFGAVCLKECKLHGDRDLPYAWWGDDERGAFVDYFFDDGWLGDYFFAVVGEVR